MEERSFPARVEALAHVLPYVTSAAARAGVTAERLQQLELAIDEIVTNVCRYAYGDDEGHVLVRIDDHVGELVVEIEDGGEPFNPLEAPEPDVSAPLSARRVGGLGIFLVRRLVDELAYRREEGRNILRLTIKHP